MSNAPTETQSPIESHSSESESLPDPFLSLHKMSTTAGLGSADYVAISGSAIATILLGIGSAVVLFDNNLLLIIPLTALVCGVISFVQISRSNGTQTGRLLAALGVVLSLAFGGYVVGKQVYAGTANLADQAKVLDVIAKLSDDVKADHYEQAYQLTSDTLRSKVSQTQFADRFKSMSAVPVLGHVSKIEWNGHIEFENDPVTGDRLATTYMKIAYAKVNEAERSPIIMDKGPDGWQIASMPNVFPPDQPTPPHSGAAKRSGPVQPAGPPAPK